MIYHIITAGSPLKPQRPSRITLTARNIYWILLLFHDRLLNFRENIGNSETKRSDMNITNNNKYKALNECIRLLSSIIHIANELQKRAFAGVGIPINDVV